MQFRLDAPFGRNKKASLGGSLVGMPSVSIRVKTPKTKLCFRLWQEKALLMRGGDILRLWLSLSSALSLHTSKRPFRDATWRLERFQNATRMASPVQPFAKPPLIQTTTCVAVVLNPFRPHFGTFSTRNPHSSSACHGPHLSPNKQKRRFSIRVRIIVEREEHRVVPNV